MAFVAFVATVAAATNGPLYRLAEDRLAVAHAVLLILLLNLAPLLLMRALTPQIVGPSFARVAGWSSGAQLSIPIVALTVVVYAWHVPALFDAATARPLLAAAQHLSLLGVGLLVWWPIAAPEVVRPTMRGLVPVFYMAADELLVGALGVVLTWAPDPLFETYTEAPRSWGLSASTDQMLAGATLTAVEELPLVVVLVVLFIRMLTREERELQEQERAEPD